MRIIAADRQIMIAPEIADVFQRSFGRESRHPDLIEELTRQLAQSGPWL